MSFWETVGKWLPDGSDVLSSAVRLYGDSEARDANSDAAEKNAAMAEEAARLISMGYDQQTAFLLAGLADVGQWTDAGYTAYTNGLTGLAKNYAGDMTAGGDAYADTVNAGFGNFRDAIGSAVGDYAGGMGEAYAGYGYGMGGASDEFGNAVTANAEDYAGEIMPSAWQYGDDLFAGQDAAMGYFDPYLETGDAALARLAETMAVDPNELTPEQQILLRDFRGDQAAKLAASGLRGAGAAGVGAQMRSEADLRAKLYSDNRDRADRATASLAQMGYGASGQGANMTMNNATRAAGTMFDTTQKGLAAVKAAGDTAATNRFQTAADVAKVGYQTAADVARTGYQAAGTVANTGWTAANNIAGQQLADDRTVAQTTLGLGKDAVAQTGNYYGNKAQLAANAAQIAGQGAMGKAQAAASAKTQGGAGVMQAALNNAAIQGQSLGSIAQVIASGNRNARLASSYPNYTTP